MRLKKSDIFFAPKYAELYLDKQTDTLFVFEYQKGNNFFYFCGIKRAINKEYFDVESPYGYGGILCSFDKKFLKEAIGYLKKRCQEEKIIAIFIRFHPFNTSRVILKDFLDFYALNRYVAVANLQKKDVFSIYSSKTKNIIRKAQKLLDLSKVKI